MPADVRNWINQNNTVVTVIAVVIMLTAVAYIVTRNRSGGVTSGVSYYYDTVTKKVFTDQPTKIAPFTSPEGNPAVKAHFFTCADCTEEVGTDGADGKRFIGYYEKYTDEVKAKLEKAGTNFMMIEMTGAGRLYSTDGEKWVAAENAEGLAITQQLQSRCPPKKLRYCSPE